MKIRHSFVANSSSSSFILGTDINQSVSEHTIKKLDNKVIPHPYAKWSIIKEYTPEMIAYYLMGRLKPVCIHWDEFEKFIKKATVRDLFTIYDKKTQSKYYLYNDVYDIINDIVNEVSYSLYDKLYEVRYSLPEDKIPKNLDEDIEFNIKFFTPKKSLFINALTEFMNIYKDKSVYMGEIPDENSFEAGIEHNEKLWGILGTYMKFSKH
jgi:hypothetical protein